MLLFIGQLLPLLKNIRILSPRGFLASNPSRYDLEKITMCPSLTLIHALPCIFTKSIANSIALSFSFAFLLSSLLIVVLLTSRSLRSIRASLVHPLFDDTDTRNTIACFAGLSLPKSLLSRVKRSIQQDCIHRALHPTNATSQHRSLRRLLFLILEEDDDGVFIPVFINWFGKQYPQVAAGHNDQMSVSHFDARFTLRSDQVHCKLNGFVGLLFPLLFVGLFLDVVVVAHINDASSQVHSESNKQDCKQS